MKNATKSGNETGTVSEEDFAGATGESPPAVMIPRWLVGRATPFEVAVILALQSHFPNIWPSLNTLAAETCMSKRGVMQVLAGMEKKGWLKRKQRRKETGSNASTLYQLTIWSWEWQKQAAEKRLGLPRDRAQDALGQDMPKGGIGHEVPKGRAHGAHEGIQAKKTKLKTQEPPFVFPPIGESAGQAVATHIQPDPYLDPLEDQDPNPLPEHPDPCPHKETHQRPLEAAVSDENPLKASFPDHPQQEALETLLEASEENTPAKGKKPRFQPTEADIPAILLPVRLEILGFWKAKAGKKTSEAWDALLANLHKIWDDPAGGTDVLRQQLEAGIEAKTYGKGWQSITYANWSKYGKEWHRSNIQPRLTENQKTSLLAVAKIRAMEAAKNQTTNPILEGASL